MWSSLTHHTKLFQHVLKVLFHLHLVHRRLQREGSVSPT